VHRYAHNKEAKMGSSYGQRSMLGIGRDSNIHDRNVIKMLTRTNHKSLYEEILSRPQSWNTLNNAEMETIKKFGEKSK